MKSRVSTWGRRRAIGEAAPATITPHPGKARRAASVAACCLLAFAVTFAAAAESGSLPADAGTALARLDASPRHGEWIDIEGPTPDSGKGMRDSVRAWISYPERGTKAPVVIVIHEIFGLTDWIRAVADQLAAEGFIAVAPDLLTGHGPEGSGTPAETQAAIALVRGLDKAEVMRRLSYVADFATALPAATQRFGSVGFCWGGGTSFSLAASDPDLAAAVVYYGSAPDASAIEQIRAPVLAHYGGNDMRVNATIPDAEAAMTRFGKSYSKRVYDGAGHGFLRQQDGQDGANAKATEAAWPETVAFFKKNLEP